MSKTIDQYDHKQIEPKLQAKWRAQDLYKWDSTKSREENFVIDTPPPTVSGLLHMGHIFSYTQADFIARYQRMKGKNVFYPMGFDDNGLPTERLVEKSKKIRARDLPRHEFKNICIEVVEESEKEFEKLFDQIGVSVDWSQKYQTVGKHATTISQMSFLDLHEKGHIYRALEPTLWDPIDQTALAQTDLEDVEHKGIMNSIKFSTSGNEEIIIATTRPELLPACVAVLFNPLDTRYQHLLGATAYTPLLGEAVPIIADEQVELDKGTGLVMCCTFGDTTDIEWWKKHKLPLKIILDHAGRINLNTNSDLALLLNKKKIAEARDLIIQKLNEEGLLVSQIPVLRMVKCAERSKSPIEILVTPQWFIRILDKKDALLQKSEECNWHPEFMKHRLENWISGIKWDWCISRQRFFGVPFPAWYSKRKGEEGKILLASKDQLPLDPLVDLPKGYSRDEVDADLDVMDTWATSSVSTQINSHAINSDYAIDYERHKKLFPADLRPQSHEIIRTWAFGSIVKSMLHEDSKPWHNLMISGWVLAADKTKMSKSKGNVITPFELVQEKGADVVRYWASTSKLGTDVAYSEDMFKIGKKLINKLWNAAKFVHTQTSANNPNDLKLTNIKNNIDKWVISRLAYTINEATKQFEVFEYSDARSAIEHFFWNDFCDNYLELVKLRAYDPENKDPEGQLSAKATLYFVLEILLKLFAPILPHTTEELYNLMYSEQSIHQNFSWPKSDLIKHDKDINEMGNNIISLLNQVRKYKSEKQVSMKFELDTIEIQSSSKDFGYFGDALEDLRSASNSQKILITLNKENTLSEEFNIIIS